MTWRLWLVRHGETEWSRSGRHTGSTDVPLTPEGEERAQRLRGVLGRTAFAAVYSSPLERARRTAELAGFPDPTLTTLLREFDYGDYEGQTTPEIRRARPNWEIFHDGCPHGETPEAVYERAREFVALAEQAGGDVLAFCHGHISRAVTVAFLGWPVTLAAGLANLGAGGLAVLADGDRGRVLDGWNGAP